MTFQTFKQAPIQLLEERKSAIRGKHEVDPVFALARSSGNLASLALPDIEARYKSPPKSVSRYNQAQVNEKPAFRVLLKELCNTIPPLPPQVGAGARRIPIEDVIFALVYKVYIGTSSRRFMSDMLDMRERGFLSRNVSYNSICGKFIDPSLTPLLKSLIEGIAASLAHVETAFAVDSTGFRIPKITEWCDEKHGWRRRHEWLKVHVMCGTRTHIVAAVEVTKRNIGDSTCFEPLVSTTSKAFQIDQIAADRAYSTIKNLEHADGLGIFPAIPFKQNANPFRHAEDSVWRRMFHLFALNQAEYSEMVNRQNQAESTFSMMKRRFGEKVYSKSDTAQVNEILCKVICHNLVVLIHWLYQFGVDVGDFPVEPPPSPHPREPPKSDALDRVWLSLDQPIPGTEIPRIAVVADTAPTPIDDAIEKESLTSIVDRLINEQGLTREKAWSIVEMLL